MSIDINNSQLDIDNLLERLLEVRECHLPDKFVQIFEQEINLLCEKSKDVFLSQPMLLELEAPIKICGKRWYNIKLWKSFNNCFNCLPVAAIVAGKIFCCQGGLSPDLHSLEQIQQIQRPIDVPDTALMLLDGIRLNNKADKQSENRISRSLSSLFDLRRLGLLCDLLWSDPDNDLKGWSENDAGISLRFGVDIVNE
ncbi:unnamed protein product, partial [Rotaria magnacalcarata]